MIKAAGFELRFNRAGTMVFFTNPLLWGSSQRVLSIAAALRPGTELEIGRPVPEEARQAIEQQVARRLLS